MLGLAIGFMYGIDTNYAAAFGHNQLSNIWTSMLKIRVVYRAQFLDPE